MQTHLGRNLAAMVLGAACALYAIEIPADIRNRLFGDLDARTKAGAFSSGMDAMDNSIDENTYRIGGGDVFEIDITNLPSKNYTPIVGSDGNLFDDELGLVPVSGLTLKEAREKITAHVRKILRKDYDIRVVLRKVKTVNISVTGNITVPGNQLLPGTSRILDAIKQANQSFLPSSAGVNLREVVVKSLNGKETSYDLMKYLVGQDATQNPYIYPGDQIHIFPIDAQVYIVGEVHSPTKGFFPLRKNETLASLVQSIHFTSRADSSHVQLQHAGNHQPAVLSIANDGSTLLQDGDVLFFNSADDFIVTDTVTVSGKVSRPGVYPMANGTTTVEEIIRAAGGARPDGDALNWIVVRRYKLNALKTPESPSDKLSAVTLPSPRLSAQASASFVRPEMRAAVADLFLGGDFSLVFPIKDRPTYLMPGDEIHIPVKENFVYLSGAVGIPGPQPYREGASFDDYVKMAGGLSNKADRINAFSMTVFSGLTSIKTENNIRPGDILVIPSAVEYKRLSAVYLPMIQTMATVVTTVLTGFLVYNQIK